MDIVDMEHADIFRVELHTTDRPLLVFSTLAQAIAYLARHNVLIYKLDVIEGDIIHTLVSRDDAERAFKAPEDGLPPAEESPNVVDMLTRKPIDPASHPMAEADQSA